MKIRLITICLAALLHGCSNDQGHAAFEVAKAPVASPSAARVLSEEQPRARESSGDVQTPRYVALHHSLQVATDAQGLEAAWRQTVQACLVAGCDILESSLNADRRYGAAGASLDARIPPAQLDGFLAQIGSLGHVGQHTMAAEDRTNEVIDVEARLKNLTEFRDHLRRLLATPGAKLSEVMEVQRELVRVQSDLDSLASRRKLLAQETAKVRVTVQFNAQLSMVQRGLWAPVADTWANAGRMFADSTAGLITLMALSLPWLAGLGLGLTALRFWWRRRSLRRRAVS